MNGKVVTVFGGGGFIGRYVVQALLRDGARVRVAQRNPKQAFFLKGGANLGQIQFVMADVTNADSVAAAVAGSDAVINLVGILKGDFDAIQAHGAKNVAEAAAAAGVKAFVHMSAIGADVASLSSYGRTKGEGEAAVRAAFPTATIMRPSLIFGREDGFVNRFAQLIGLAPLVPIMRGETKFQPVFVGDVARAFARALADGGSHGGKTYNLGGPAVMTMAEINRWIAKAIGQKRFFVDVPDQIGAAMARFTGFLPGAPITWDQWLMLQDDNVAEPNGLAALGIDPTPLDVVAPGWLVRYRRQGRFNTKAGAA